MTEGTNDLVTFEGLKGISHHSRRINPLERKGAHFHSNRPRSVGSWSEFDLDQVGMGRFVSMRCRW